MLDYRVHTFLEVCSQGSYTKAARALCITQPAVSQHIRFLEQHYRAKLFSQQGRSLELTREGRILHRELLALANNEREVERALAEKDPETAPLSFGATLTASDYIAPLCVAEHLRTVPNARISMQVANTHELLERIDQGEIDFALVEGYFDEGAYESLTFSREPYVAVCATEAPLPKAVDHVEELLGQTLLLREPGSGTREVLERGLAVRGLSPSSFARTCELGSVSAIKSVVQAGAGIAFLYRAACARELDVGSLRDITPTDLPIAHDFSFIWQRGSLKAAQHRALFARWRGVYLARTEA